MINRRTFFKLTGSAITLAASNCGKDETHPPNIVLILADDLGYGDLSCYGHPVINTPRIDNMAAEGIRFTSFYSASSHSTPSLAATLTGRYPVRTGLYTNILPETKGGLCLSEIILPQLLSKAGYRTMAVGKWHLGHQPENYLPTHRGFDSFYGLLYSNDMVRPWMQTNVPLQLYRDTSPIEQPVDQAQLTERYTYEALKFIKATPFEKPFFLYFAHSMPHIPVSTSDQFSGQSAAGRYGDAIETIDWSAGQILDTLTEKGLNKKTLVIFTSDSGAWASPPQQLLRKGVRPWHCGSSGLLRGDKDSTYEGGLRVPCIVRWPGHIAEGKVSREMATTMDLFTTILEAGNIPKPSDRIIDGHNIMPFLKGDSVSPTSEFFYFHFNELKAMRDDQWKCLSNSSKNSAVELYNLNTDPSERYNLAKTHPQHVQRMLQRMSEFAAETHSVFQNPKHFYFKERSQT